MESIKKDIPHAKLYILGREIEWHPNVRIMTGKVDLNIILNLEEWNP